MRRKFLLIAILLCALACACLAGCGGNKACAHEHATFTGSEATCEQAGEKTYTCPDCHQTWTEELDPLGHDFKTDEASSSPATCTSAGKSVQVCSRCGQSKTEAIPQLQHEYELDEGSSVAGSCTTTAVTVKVCKYCHDRKEEYTPAAGHKWEGSDCTGRKCTVCNETLPATASHSYAKKSEKAATCTEDGETIYACSLCGDEYSVTLPHTGHNFVVESESGEYQLKDAATCTYTSEHTLKCTVCEATEKEKFEVAGRHEFVTSITKPATCTEAGVRTTACKVCKTVKGTESFTDADAHKWDEGVQKNGVVTYTCQINKAHTKSSIVAEAGAKEVNVTKDAMKNADEVVVKDAAIVMDQKAKESLPSGDLVLGVDAAKAEDIDPSWKDRIENDVYNITLSTGGSNITEFDGGKVKVRLPYTLKEGEDVNAIVIWYVDGEELTSVEAVYSNGYVTFETTHFSYYTVGKYTPEEMCAKYGHNTVTNSKIATCTQSGYLLEICARCGERVKESYTPALGHQFEESVTKPATCTETGILERRCVNDNCDRKFETVIPATGHDWQEIENVPATCQKAGKESYSCSKCKESYTITLPQRAHEFTTSVKEATCTEEGYTTFTCKYCGYSYQGNKVSALGHRWNIDAPTCGEGQICTVCGAEGRPATGNHNYDDNGVCTVCGAGCEHDFEVVDDVESTCQTAGYTLSRCTKCGREQKSDYKPLGAHKYGPDGTCTVCGARNEAASGFYDVFLKSLNAKKFTIELGTLTFKSKDYTDSELDGENELSIKGGTGSIIFTEDGLLFRFHLEDIVPPRGVGIKTIDVIYDGTDVYLKRVDAEGIEAYEKESAEEAPEQMNAIFEILRDEALLNYLSDLKTENNEVMFDLVQKVMDKFFERKQTANGYDLVVSGEFMVELSRDLSTLSVEKFVNKYFGENKFQVLTELIKKLTVEKKMSEAIEEVFTLLKQYHVEREEFLPLMEGILKKVTGEEIDFEEMLKDPSLADQSLAEMIDERQGAEPGAFAQQLTGVFDHLKEEDCTFFALFAQMTGEPTTEQVIPDFIETLFGSGKSEFAFHTDDAGNIQSAGIVLKGFEWSFEEKDEATGKTEKTEISITGEFTVTWNQAEEIKLDKKDYGPMWTMTDYIRQECAKNNGTYTVTLSRGEGNYRTITTLLWTLKDGVLSLQHSERTENVYNYEERPGEGAVERGEIREQSVLYPDVMRMTFSVEPNCGDWIYYYLYLSSSSVKAVRTSYSYIRTYDTKGNEIDFQKYDEESGDGYLSGLRVYFNSKTNEFGSESKHNPELDEARSQTEDDVECGEYYIVYQTCTICGKTVNVNYMYKYHDYEEKSTLKEGFTTCEEGAILRRTCKNCGKTEEQEIDYHFINYTTEEIELPHGTLYFSHGSCPCGENGSWNMDGDACDFEYQSKYGDLRTYVCVYEGCTAKYTLKETMREEGCQRICTELFKFYVDGKPVGNPSGYQVTTTDYVHEEGELISKKEGSYTLEKDGYLGDYFEYVYAGCPHTGKITYRSETRYDQYGRTIYSKYTTTKESGFKETAQEHTYTYTGCDYVYKYREYKDGVEVGGWESSGTSHVYEEGKRVDGTCTQPGYTEAECLACHKKFIQVDRYVNRHDFASDGTCRNCGLKSGQGVSGDVMLEDLTNYSEGKEYCVGVYTYLSSIHVQLYLIYLNANGEEEMVPYDGTFTRAYRYDETLVDEDFTDHSYLLKTSMPAVKSAVDPSKNFVGLRFTFLPNGGDSTQVSSITLVDETRPSSLAIPVSQPADFPETKRYFA